ncbi:restriction endonuclease subunit S [Empedobacter falsenii]
MSYKKLGDYIQVVDDRNKELLDLPLLGVSVQKVFIPSIANTVGTDMSKYKILSRNQFTYIPDTSRRGDKIGVALLKLYDRALVSQAYTTFKIIDENLLNPDYLMMWFCRPEFDRYARYHSIGSVREVFDWEDLCEVELPVPSIEKQREIVAQFQAVANKIKVNEQICEKLEATAQTLYKHWFVDFEFPNEEGQPYKSSGGAMVFNEELEKEIPEGWEVGTLGEITLNYDSKRKPVTSSERKKGVYPYYGAAALMDYVDDYIFDGTYVLLGEDGTVINKDGTPVLQFVWGKIWVNNHAHVLQGTNGFNVNSLYLLLKNTNVSEIVTGGVQAKINKANLNSIITLMPYNKILEIFNNEIEYYFESLKNYKTQNQKLTQLQSLLLSRLATLEG